MKALGRNRRLCTYSDLAAHQLHERVGEGAARVLSGGSPLCRIDPEVKDMVQSH